MIMESILAFQMNTIKNLELKYFQIKKIVQKSDVLVQLDLPSIDLFDDQIANKSIVELSTRHLIWIKLINFLEKKLIYFH